MVLFFIGFLMSPTNSNAQNCSVPTGLNVTNLSNFSTTLNWDLDSSVDHYRLRFKEVGSSNWLFQHNATGVSHDIFNLNSGSTYIWQAKAFCSAGDSIKSGWSVLDTFTTTSYIVDCNNTPNGTAYLDTCGNCVEGTTGQLPCIAFTPAVTISLNHLYCDSVADFSFSFSQDPSEPDVSSAVFSSDSGYFNFSGLSLNDTVGSSINMAAGGQVNVTTTLLVDFIINTDKISVKSVDNNTLQVLTSFTIENTPTGILIIATSPPDGNNVTQGNSQAITLSGLFVNPGAGTLTFTSTINSEIGDVDVQTFPFTISCLAVLDCNGDPNGTAFIDSCGNCVGGNTGNLACIPFSPTVGVLLSNTDCDSLTDLTINVAQDPNEPDMSTSLFVSDGGSFAISLLSVGDTVGSAVMTANGGAMNFSTNLVVSSIPSSTQAILESINISNGLSLGTFTISNSVLGIDILVQSPPDGNNVTLGNTSSVTFNNIFVNPGAST
ncbi:MAG: hypothetical protein CMD14_00910, partial [Flavobacteriales bacterium]|nr:hypothetical protein [Flavobacteriales bacterium]